MDVDISICIPTHERPKLFERCINSVIDNVPKNLSVDVFVNNDTNDIDEIYTDKISINYSYNKTDSLVEMYYSLVNTATGKYIYILEDDDYILPGFFSGVTCESDIYFNEYISKPILQDLGPRDHDKRMRCNRKLKNITNPQLFFENMDSRDFQFSQIIFLRKYIDILAKLKVHWEPNSIVNDFNVLKYVCLSAKTITYMSGYRWVQTIDSGNNLSFSEQEKK